MPLWSKQAKNIMTQYFAELKTNGLLQQSKHILSVEHNETNVQNDPIFTQSEVNEGRKCFI